MIKVLTVFGTRPEAIKMAPLVKELQSRKEIESIVCVTAQHREMLDQVLEVFNITPDFDLNIMKSRQTLADITSAALVEVGGVITKVKPDIVLVHGDTTTTFASSLAAFYNGVKVGHVEAGLRTWDIQSPFPEEANRRFVSVVSDLNFAPTNVSSQNLLNEGKDPDSIFITGNTAIDSMRYTIKSNYHNAILDWVGNDKLILLTAHRRENLGTPMRNIFRAIKSVLVEHKDFKVVYPVHLNPKVRDIANDELMNVDNIKLIEPLDVFDFHNILDRSYFVLTDSGGIQEEAPSLGKPVLVLRDTTERPEGVEAGTLKLIGTSQEEVYSNIKKLIEDEIEYEKMSKANNPYGDGKASKRIVDAIVERLKL